MELSAAGRSDEAIARAAKNAEVALLRWGRDDGQKSAHYDMQTARFAAWQAGAPWVHAQLADGTPYISPSPVVDGQPAAVTDQN